MRMIKRMLLAALAVAASVCVACSAEAADPLRIAVQKTGTASWEIEVIKARGLDKAANLDIETIELASTDAAKVALMGGGADMIAEDWLWAARERALGDRGRHAEEAAAHRCLGEPARLAARRRREEGVHLARQRVEQLLRDPAAGGQVNDEQPLRHADLRGRKPHARRRVHRLDHVIDQRLDLVVHD